MWISWYYKLGPHGETTLCVKCLFMVSNHTFLQHLNVHSRHKFFLFGNFVMLLWRRLPIIWCAHYVDWGLNARKIWLGIMFNKCHRANNFSTQDTWSILTSGMLSIFFGLKDDTCSLPELSYRHFFTIFFHHEIDSPQYKVKKKMKQKAFGVIPWISMKFAC